MGIHHSKFLEKRQTKTIDHGSTKPLGLYQPNCEYDSKRIQALIESKRLSPFYKGLANPFDTAFQNETDKKSIKSIKSYRSKRKLRRKERLDLYQNAIECPICFLYYPANINFTRCCDQPICTECFVQIKKNPSDFRRDIDCPYCMTESFGVVYYRFSLDKTSVSSEVRSTTSGITSDVNTRRKSLDSNHPSVVLIDHMKPTTKKKKRSSSKRRPRSHTVSFDRRLSDSMMEGMTLQDMIVFRAISHSLIDNDATVHSQP